MSLHLLLSQAHLLSKGQLGFMGLIKPYGEPLNGLSYRATLLKLNSHLVNAFS
jgi:hypothetical protein